MKAPKPAPVVPAAIQTTKVMGLLITTTVEMVTIELAGNVPDDQISDRFQTASPSAPMIRLSKHTVVHPVAVERA